MPATRRFPPLSRRRGPAPRSGPLGGPLVLMIATALITAGALGALASHLPPPLVLPVVSLILLTAAIAAALLAHLRPARDPKLPGYWDVSGALTFAGISAALLSEPEAVLPLLEAAMPSRTND
jgi:hypothetical protein